MARAKRAVAAAAGTVGGRWSIPEGWEWLQARSFAQIVGGGTPKEAADPQNFDESGTPWITPADLSGYSRSTIAAGRRNLSPLGLSRSSAKIMPRGTVLISSRAPVGYCAVAANEVTTNQGFRSLVLDPGIDPHFIRYYVLASRGYLEDHASGTTFKELSGSALGDLVFPIPPLDTQRRIVARIEELFAELDDGEAALTRARADLDTYRKALLKAAVTGELTADWRASNPTDETGDQLLMRILAERKARWEAELRNRGRRYKEPVSIDPDDLTRLPDGWAWASLEQLSVEPTRNGLSIKEAANETEVRALRLDALTDEGVDWSKFRYLPKTLSEVPGYILKEGDLLVSRANGSPQLVGRGSLVHEPPDGMIFPDTAIRYRLGGDAVVCRWIALAWAAPNLRQQLLSYAKTTAGILKVSQEDIRQVRLPIPPRAELLAAVNLVDEGLASQRRLLPTVRDGAGQSAQLRQSILSAAFRGELVK